MIYLSPTVTVTTGLHQQYCLLSLSISVKEICHVKMAQFLCLAYVLYRQWFLNQGQHIKACKLAFKLGLSMHNNTTQ